MTTTAAAWILTYLAHSTVLLAGAWLVARSGVLRSLSAREWLWRGALVGGVIGASVQTFAGVTPWTVSAPLPERVRAAAEGPPRTPEAIRDVPAARPFALDRSSRVSSEQGEASGIQLQRSERGATRTSRVAPVPAVPGREHESSWIALLRERAPALGTLLLGLWLVGLSARARLALGRRRAVRAGPWLAALEELRASARIRRRVRLTSSARVATPVALGVLRPEICVPERAMRELAPDLARSALAHELAHVARLDPLWLGIAHVARSLLMIQPLNRIAARELAHLAELAADEWAARRTGDPLALARCLTEVAGWLRPLAPPLGTCAMARRGGRLEERVRRLLDARDDGPREGRRAPAFSAVAVIALAPWTLPGWSAAPVAPPAATTGAATSSSTAEGADPATRTWNGAERAVEELLDELSALEDLLAAAPTNDSARRAELSERIRASSDELARLRAAVRRGLALERTR